MSMLINNVPTVEKFIEEVKVLLHSARNYVTTQINTVMVSTYFEIGRRIVEQEQNGASRAQYGNYILDELSDKLTKEFGRGFSTTNLKQMRSFYVAYNQENKIRQTPSDEFKLGWSHYLKLMRIGDINERKFYEIECHKNNWSLREFQRQFDAALYQRLVLSRDKEKIEELAEKGQVIESAQDALKDPYILEFIGLPEQSTYSESELEQALIDKLEHFLLELGRGFTFVGRQVRFTFDDEHFRVDLVFFNRFLRSFVLIDLKIGKLKHQDLGQMQMYVNYYDRFVKTEDENKTIGIILCRDKKDALVEITLPEENNQIFASRYQTVLPSKEELKRLIESKQE